MDIYRAIVTNHQTIAVLVAFISLLAYLFRAMQKISKLEQTKEIIDEKIKTLEQKYETSERIKRVEIDIERLSTESKAVRENLILL